jgi:GT2 family glycosyltransferase
VIVPVFNGEQYLPRCLDAITATSAPRLEVIVVDDASTDDSGAIARATGARVLKLASRGGPGAARNHGAAAARGRILFFVDADVVIRPEAVMQVVADLDEHPEVAAVFGSYDDSPAEQNFVSQYKNLYHHFTHQQGREDATTFWSGCGAVRRAVFVACGGFDERQFWMEDIELGYRLRRLGYRILLDKKLQGTHLKRWTLGSLLRADILYRAIPWSRLILDSGTLVNDLNLKTTERASAALVMLSVALLPWLPWRPVLVTAEVAMLGLVLALNHRLYRFLARRRGVWFAARAVPLHWLYYLYSTGAFGWCWCAKALSGSPARRLTR